MTTFADMVKEFWGVMVGFVGFIAWQVRLEARANQNNKDLERLERRFEQRRQEDLQNARRDWDELKTHMTQIQADIRELLQRTSHHGG